MTGNAYLKLLRVYSALALRKRRTYIDAVRAIVVLRWEAAQLGVAEVIDREEIKMSLAVDAARNYGLNDPAFKPTIQEAYSWMS